MQEGSVGSSQPVGRAVSGSDELVLIKHETNKLVNKESGQSLCGQPAGQRPRDFNRKSDLKRLKLVYRLYRHDIG